VVVTLMLVSLTINPDLLSSTIHSNPLHKQKAITQVPDCLRVYLDSGKRKI